MLFSVETKPALRGEGTDVLYVIRDVNGRMEGWKDGWMDGEGAFGRLW